MNLQGLNKQQVEESRQKHGANTLTQIPPEPLWKKILERIGIRPRKNKIDFGAAVFRAPFDVRFQRRFEIGETLGRIVEARNRFR